MGNCISLLILKAQDFWSESKQEEEEEEAEDWVNITFEIQNFKHSFYSWLLTFQV